MGTARVVKTHSGLRDIIIIELEGDASKGLAGGCRVGPRRAKSAWDVSSSVEGATDRKRRSCGWGRVFSVLVVEIKQVKGGTDKVLDILAA